MRSLKLGFIGFIVCIVILSGVATASMFGEENGLLSKILLEDIQHTLKLQTLVGFAGSQLKALNEKYGYDRWINKGLDKVKDYGVLSEFKTDDYVIGKLQSDTDKLGIHFGRNDYSMDSVNKWVDKLWGTSPEILNSQTQYPGDLGDWSFQINNHLPHVFTGSYSLRSEAGRESAELAYKRALWNMQFVKQSEANYKNLLFDSQSANPGEASRITAVSSSLQNMQLSQINDTQSTLLKLVAEKQLTSNLEENIKTTNMQSGFVGIKSIFQSMPTPGQ